uniref:Uncharacterized protein n=1 Tax=Lepeophtheirus salmonis TaxID=72036 RepID=A0A0K2TTH2_LEPSM
MFFQTNRGGSAKLCYFKHHGFIITRCLELSLLSVVCGISNE